MGNPFFRILVLLSVFGILHGGGSSFKRKRRYAYLKKGSGTGGGAIGFRKLNLQKGTSKELLKNQAAGDLPQGGGGNFQQGEGGGFQQGGGDNSQQGEGGGFQQGGHGGMEHEVNGGLQQGDGGGVQQHGGDGSPRAKTRMTMTMTIEMGRRMSVRNATEKPAEEDSK